MTTPYTQLHFENYSGRTEQNTYEYGDYDYSQFYACEKQSVKAFGKIFLPVLYTLVFGLGFIGNTLLLVIVLKYVKHKSMTEVYLLNLAVSDLLFVLTLPFWSVYAASEWVFGNTLCKMLSTVYTANFFSGIFFISCMSLDMYLAIVHTYSSKNLRTTGKGLVVCSAVWIISFLFSVPDMVFSQVEHHAGKQTCVHVYGELRSVWKLLLKFHQNVLGFLLPLLCMVFFYTRIACALITSKADGKEKALKLILLLVAVFFLLWFPYNTVLFLHSLQDLGVIADCEMSKHLDFAMQVTESAAFVHSCLNPLLYAFVNKRFRRYLEKILEAVIRKRNIFVLQSSETTKSSSKHVQIEMTNIQAMNL